MSTQALFAKDNNEFKSQFLSLSGKQNFAVSVLSVLLAVAFLFFVIWQVYQAQFYNPQLVFSLYSLFAISGALLLLQSKYEKLSKAILILQSLTLAFVSVSIYSSNTVFLITSLVLVFLSAFVFGSQFCFAFAAFTAAFMNFAIVISGFPFEKILWTSVVVYNGSLFVGSIAASFLSSELRVLAADIGATRENLRQLQNISDQMIDKMASGVLAISKAGQIIKSNPEARKVFEVTDFEDLYAEDLSIELWNRVKNFDKPEFFEIEQESVEGYLMKLETYIIPLDSSQGGGWLVFFQNRTKIKNMEEKLRQSEKLAAVGQLAAGIAHEIRNPLASISGSIQLLAGSIAVESKEDKKLLAIVIKEIDRLNDLISEFMEYVRPDVLEKNEVNLGKILNDVIIHLKKNPVASDIEFDLNLTDKAIIQGSSTKLQQAFLNILINACHAVNDSEVKKISVNLQAEEDVLVLKIVDTGSGIPKDQIKKIFQPFHTTKPRGTGLGLAVTYRIFEVHNAEVSVTSQVGEGTQFEIRFEKRI